MGFFKEFKEFAVTGNLIDVAAAFVMGGAVAKVISAFIDGMVMPLIGLVTGGTDFNKKKIVLTQAVDAVKDSSGKVVSEAVSENAVLWGTFISQCIQFIAVALVVFVALKAINNMKKAKAAEAPAGPSSTDVLLGEIRDALKK